jgi:hypothetical protein
LLLVAIKILKPNPLILELPVTPAENMPNSSSSSSSTTTTRKTIKKEIHSPLFDLNLARASLLADLISNVSMGLAQSPIQFGLSSTFSALGVSFNPAVQSVALALYARRGGIETGKLFGALSLIQAIRYDTFMWFFTLITVSSVQFSNLSSVRLWIRIRKHRRHISTHVLHGLHHRHFYLVLPFELCQATERRRISSTKPR